MSNYSARTLDRVNRGPLCLPTAVRPRSQLIIFRAAALYTGVPCKPWPRNFLSNLNWKKSREKQVSRELALFQGGHEFCPRFQGDYCLFFEAELYMFEFTVLQLTSRQIHSDLGDVGVSKPRSKLTFSIQRLFRICDVRSGDVVQYTDLFCP